MKKSTSWFIIAAIALCAGVLALVVPDRGPGRHGMEILLTAAYVPQDSGGGYSITIRRNGEADLQRNGPMGYDPRTGPVGSTLRSTAVAPRDARALEKLLGRLAEEAAAPRAEREPAGPDAPPSLVAMNRGRGLATSSFFIILKDRPGTRGITYLHTPDQAVFSWLLSPEGKTIIPEDEVKAEADARVRDILRRIAQQYDWPPL